MSSHGGNEEGLLTQRDNESYS
jgi:hypothetical protein